MLRRALLTTALLPTPLITVPAPAQAANGPTATLSAASAASAADNGSWLLDKLIVANPTTAPITGSGYTVRAADKTNNTLLPAEFRRQPDELTLTSGKRYLLTGNGGQWSSFDDTWSIQQKSSRLKTKGLLGAMVWEMSGDTPSGTLVTALHSGLS